MARCLVCLLLLAAHAAAGSLDTGFAVRFNLVEGHESVHVRDRSAEQCNLNSAQSKTVQLHEHDILVVSIAQDSPRSCLVNITASPLSFNLDNDTDFARLALEGWPVNVTTPFNISVACSSSHPTKTVQVTISNSLQTTVSACCAGKDPQYDWCHRCGKGQYREGLQCHPCPGRKTTPKTGVFTKDNCICPEGYRNTTDKCPKCTEGTHSVIQDGRNLGCQLCDTTQPETGPRATACPGPTPNATNTAAQTYQATQYLRPRQKKCDKECCVPGEYWHAGLERCQTCVDGYNYSDTHGATTCHPCQRPLEGGYELLGCFDKQGSKQKCKKGFYRGSDELSPFCKPCPPRKTTASEGKSDDTSCLCEEGYITDDQNGCTACEVGKYKSGLGGTVCTQCPQHKTTRSEGSTTIQDCVCDYGFYGENGAALCSRCERRQYQDELGRDECEECEICPYGGYATGCGGANPGQCRTCTDANCPGAAEGERCDFCGICNFDREYYRTKNISDPPQYANSTMDMCGVCDGNITEAKDYKKCHKCPAGTTGEDGPRVCNETERGGDNEMLYAEITHASQCRVCEDCQKGTFKSTEGSATCDRCPIGKYADVTGLTACRDCGANKTTASTGSIGVEYCHCEPGFYHNHTNGTDDHQCFRCEPGTFSEALNHHVCNDCEAGKYNHHMVVNVSDTCLSCARNTWSGDGAPKCIECVHSITYHKNSNSILDCKCKPGYMNSSNGEGICIPCDPGTYSERYSSDQCESCLAGKYSNATAATSNATCASCDVGTFAPAGASACELCPAGKYADARDTGKCTRCHAGKYSTTLAARSNTTCTDCPGDSSSLAGSDALSDCVCNQGYSGSAGGQCAACEAGQYSSALDENNGRDCIDCARGKYSLTLAASDQGVCIDCARGKYSSTLAASNEDACISCPSNSSSLPGSDVLTDCKCNDGYAGSDGGACSLCPADTYSSYDSNAKEATCQACPSNANSDIGSYRRDDCQCNAGYAGSADTTCEPCEVGKYKFSNSGVACNPCQAGKYSDSPGAILCTNCEQGKYSTAEGASSESSCVSCANGQSSPEGSDSSTDCYDCPAGKYEGGIQGQQPNICVSCHQGTYSDTAGRTTCEYCDSYTDAPAGSTSVSACSARRDYFYYVFARYGSDYYAGKQQFTQNVPCCTSSRGTCGYDCSCAPNC